MRIQTRIFNALERIQAPREELSIHMGLGAYRHLKREVNPDLENIHEVTHVADVPVKVNLNLAEGEIILRFEVKA